MHVYNKGEGSYGKGRQHYSKQHSNFVALKNIDIGTAAFTEVKFTLFRAVSVHYCTWC
jgi:hypothetical protein